VKAYEKLSCHVLFLYILRPEISWPTQSFGGRPDFALCPNDFSVDFTEITADFALAGVALQIEFYATK